MSSFASMLKTIIDAEERLKREVNGITNFNLGIDTEHHPVTSPRHYKAGDTYETIRVIEAWGMNYHLGNAVKYISRAGKKGDIIEDLEKARWYLDREIENQKKARTAGEATG